MLALVLVGILLGNAEVILSFYMSIEYTQWKCLRPWDNAGICGSNGMEYYDPWVFVCHQKLLKQENKDLFMANYGLCDNGMRQTEVDYALHKCLQSPDHTIFCASNGREYTDPWKFICHQRQAILEYKDLYMINEGPCHIGSYNPDYDSSEYSDLVSATSETYSQDVTTEPSVIIEEKKEYFGKATCSNCSRDWNPVCGSDGITYTNECHLNCLQVIYLDLHKAYGGSCTKEGMCGCPDDSKPVCATNGLTYRNKCYYDCEWSLGIDISHYGSCKAHDCLCPLSDATDPVCGSDGVTYTNLCKFHCHQLRKPGLSIRHLGYCTLGPGNLMIRSNRKFQNNPEQDGVRTRQDGSTQNRLWPLLGLLTAVSSSI